MAVTDYNLNDLRKAAKKLHKSFPNPPARKSLVGYFVRVHETGATLIAKYETDNGVREYGEAI